MIGIIPFSRNRHEIRENGSQNVIVVHLKTFHKFLKNNLTG